MTARRFLCGLGTAICTLAFGLIVAGMTFGWVLYLVRQ